jgi:hypothetical protein
MQRLSALSAHPPFQSASMKKIVALALAAALTPAFASTDVGISIGIAQPGVYGRIDIGSQPPPRVIYPQPVIYVPQRVAVVQAPIYLYAPPGHQKHWGKHCGRYNACGRPVYFVQENWVRQHTGRDTSGWAEPARRGSPNP